MFETSVGTETNSLFLAMAETVPVDPHLIAQLADLEPRALSGHDRVVAVAVWDRVINYAQAQRAGMIAAVADSITPVPSRMSVRDLALLELSSALDVSIDYAGWQLEVATQLTRVLTATLAKSRSGDLPWRKATDLAERTVALTPEQARAVEAEVLPKAVSRTLSQHRRAIRAAIERVDPDGSKTRRDAMRAEMRLVARHVGDGMGTLFAGMTSEDLDLVWAAADAHARRAKASGDERTLDVLRVDALTTWAKSFLVHGDSTYCDEICTAISPEPEPRPQTSAPMRHGRPVDVRVLWDLPSLLGLATEPGELAVSGATVDHDTMRRMLADGVRLRRLLIDRETGELIDLTPQSWTVPATNGRRHAAPVTFDIVIDGDPAALTATLGTAIDNAPSGQRDAIRAMLAHPVTADRLDDRPEAETPSAALAQFVAVRDRHPVTPAAGPTVAAAADLDHTVARSQGGTTTRNNLGSFGRRWHRGKTFAWTVTRQGSDWIWTSPLGRTYRTRPHDYRRGP